MSKSEFSMLEEVQRCLKKYNIPLDTLKVIAGVSGGIDSMALLHLLHRLQVSTVVAHVNYKTRGTSSEQDEKLVRHIAHRYHYPVEVKEAPFSTSAADNFQAWARTIRYNFFFGLKEQYSADIVVTAHHRDDQIETILLKMLRGAGLDSWEGMHEIDGEIGRPLLSVPKEKIKEYTEQYDIAYRTDVSNRSLKYARNIIRNELAQRLDDKIPGWRQNILKLPSKARVFDEALAELYGRFFISEQRFLFKPFTGLKTNLQKSLLLYAIKRWRPDTSLSEGALQEAVNSEYMQTGSHIELGNGIMLVRDREFLHLKRSNGHKKNKNEAVQITKKSLEKGKVEIRCLIFERNSFENPDFSSTLYLHEARLQYPLTLRPWKPGDTFQPFGMEGHQKVSDHLTNRKVSTVQRNRVKVVETFDNKICAVIFPKKLSQNSQPGTIDEQFRCKKKNEPCLTIHHR